MLIQSAMSPPGTKEPVVERQSSDGQSDDLTSRDLRLRLRQQKLLAELGVLALQGTSFIEMLNHTGSLRNALPASERRGRPGIE